MQVVNRVTYDLKYGGLKDIDDETEFHPGNSNDESFSFCCGIREMNLEFLQDSISDSEIELDAKRLAEYTIACVADTAGAVFTDTRTTGSVHKLLSKIVKPKNLGVSYTGNSIYIWVVSKQELINFVKNEEDKAKRKLTAKKKKVHALPTKRKVTPPKSRRTKG